MFKSIKVFFFLHDGRLNEKALSLVPFFVCFIMAVEIRHIVILANVSFMFYHLLTGIERVRRHEVG